MRKKTQNRGKTFKGFKKLIRIGPKKWTAEEKRFMDEGTDRLIRAARGSH